MPTYLNVSQITKKFHQFVAVDNISFKAEAGEIVGFLGPNGAGKSTTMKIITGFLSATSGTTVINNYDISQHPIFYKQLIGYLPEGVPLYTDMKVKDFLSFVAEVRGLHGINKRNKLDQTIQLINLESVVNSRIDILSKGFKRRLGLAQALIHDPEILILDEPTDGLDPNQKFEVRKLIKDIAKNKVIILSTHILEEVEAVCNRAIIIANGKIIIDSTPHNLIALSPSANTISLKIKGECLSQIETTLSNLDAIHNIESSVINDLIILKIYPKDGYNLVPQINNLIARKNWNVIDFSMHKGQLDDLFRKLTFLNSNSNSKNISNRNLCNV